MNHLDWEEVWKIEYVFLGTLPPPNRTGLLTVRKNARIDIGLTISGVCHGF